MEENSKLHVLAGRISGNKCQFELLKNFIHRVIILFTLIITDNSLAQQPPNIPYGYDSEQVLEMGQSVSGEITVEQSDTTYILYLALGDDVYLTLTQQSGTYIPSLTVELLNGVAIAELKGFDLTVASQNVRIVMPSDETGSWLIISVFSQGARGMRVGSYILTISEDNASVSSQSDNQSANTAPTEQSSTPNPTEAPPTPTLTMVEYEPTVSENVAIQDRVTVQPTKEPSISTLLPTTESLPEVESTPTSTFDDLTAIKNGETVSGELVSGVVDSWTFVIKMSTLVSIVVESDDFDTLLELYDTSNLLLVTDDDTGIGLNAEIVGRRLLYRGQYRIGVKSYDPNAAGTYHLTLTFSSFIGTSGSVEKGAVELGTQTNGTLRDSEGDLWTFDANEGTLITALLSSEEFDAFIILYAPDGELLVSDDDSGGEINARIRNVLLPQSGEYTIWVRGYEGDGEVSGAYTLIVGTADDFTVGAG